MERLYRRYVPPEQVVSQELALVLATLSREMGRQAGIIIDRRGAIEYVIVGDHSKLFIPELGRIRAGRGRFRGIRLVHTHLNGEPVSGDDLTDLSLLSLDYVAALDARPWVNPLTMTGAHLLPMNPERKQWETLGPTPVHDFDLNFLQFIQELEGEFARKAAALKAHTGGERAMLVFLDDGRFPNPDSEAAELVELAASAGLQVVDVIRQRRRPDPRYFIGKGRVSDLIVRTMQLEADLLVFCPDLSPAQVKAISDLAEVRVIDRTQLILDIFAQRAQSRDGKLQVEAAQLRYLLPRLVGMGKAMSRLMGGIGGRGPGESKLEVDRRRVKQRLSNLEKQLGRLSSRRRERRKKRDRNQVPVVSIVGYTNTGKSTLLNTLTHAEARAENKLFATLDPYSKRLRFPQDREIVLTDTVGFIRNLPPDLKRAFGATLEELESADLLIHVVDASSRYAEEQLEAVESLLKELDLHLVPRLTVFNKIDLLDDPQVAEHMAQRWEGMALSALDRKSLLPLVQRIERMLWEEDSAVSTERTTGETDEEELRA